MTTAPPWVLLSREDLDALIDRAIEKGRELATDVWLRPEEVAEFLGVTRETVIDYTRREGLPCRYAGKTAVFKRTEVVQWLEERKTRPRSQSARNGRSLRALKGG